MTEQASTSLILACKREHLQTVEVLVRAGAELYIKDGKGRTARDICLHRSIRRRHASNPEILQKLIAVLDPSAQVDLMRLQARKDRSFSWIRTWTLLQDDRARLRGLEDQPFHVAVGMAERCCMFSPASMAWFRMLALPAPLVSHIAGFCPLPNHFYRRLALLLDRCTHDANSALVACFDIVDEVLEERGFLVALDEALIPPPSHYPSWAAWRRYRIRNLRVATSIEDITSRAPLDQLQQHVPSRPNATVAKLRLPRDSGAISEHRRFAGYLDMLCKYREILEPILTSSLFDLEHENVERLALSSDICSVVRRLGWHSECGSFSSSVAMDLIFFTIRLAI